MEQKKVAKVNDLSVIENLCGTKFAEAAKKLADCKKSVGIVYRTDIKMLKQKTNEKLFEETFGFPFGNVEKVVLATDVIAQHYGKNINDLIDKKVSEDEEFDYLVASRPWAKVLYRTSVIQHKTTGQIYLQMCWKEEHRRSVKFESITLVNGQPATDDILQWIEERKPESKTTCKKQEEAGLKEGEQVDFKMIKQENLLFFGTNTTARNFYHTKVYGI